MLLHSSPYPPIYADLAPLTRGTPVYDDLGPSRLPEYAPSMNHIGIVYLKLESRSPHMTDDQHDKLSSEFEPVVLELNSTQLNIYRIEDSKVYEYARALFENLSGIDIDPTLNIKDSKAVLRDAQYVVAAEQLKKPQLFKRSFLQSDSKSLKKKDLATVKFKLVYDLVNFQPDLHKVSQSDSLPGPHLRALRSLRGEKLKSFTMQRLVLGNAADYARKPFTLRVRAERDQLLMCPYSLKQFIEWYFRLSFAADISLPLELRDLPSVRTVPRRNRRNRRLIGLRSEASTTNTTSPTEAQFEFENGKIRRNTFSSFGEVDQEVVPLLSVAERSRTVDSDGEEEEEEEMVIPNRSSSLEMDDEEDDEEEMEGANEFFTQTSSADTSNESSTPLDPLEPSPISHYCTNTEYESRKDRPTQSWAKEYRDLRYMMKCIKPLRAKTKWVGSKLVVSQSSATCEQSAPAELPQHTRPRSNSKVKLLKNVWNVKKSDPIKAMSEYRKRARSVCVEYFVTETGLAV